MFCLKKSSYRTRYGLYRYLLLIGLFWQAYSYAEDAPAYSVLLQQSLSQAPTILEQAAYVRAAGADAEQAKAYLNPLVSGMTENLNGGGNAGSNPRQDTLTLTQPLEIGGKRVARIEARARDLIVAEARGKQVQVTFAAELATAYAAAESMTARLKVAAEDLERANDDLGVATALVNAGREAQLRISQAKAAMSATEAALQSASANRVEALERLSALSGAQQSYTGVSSNFIDHALTVSHPELSDLSNSPAILRAQAEQEAYQAQVEVERKRWIPDLGVSAGIRRFEGSGDNAFVLGLSSAIPVFDQNRDGIAAASERVIAAEARLEATKLEANANRRAAFSQVNASQRRLEAARQGESAAEEAYRLGRIGYEAGKTSLIELLLTRRSLTEAKLMTIDARYTLVRALALLASAEGRIAFGELKE